MPRVQSSSSNILFDVQSEVDIVLVRTECRRWCQQLGLSSSVEWAVTISASEAASNLVRHGEGGELKLELKKDKLYLLAVDQGPGISALEEALRDNVSQGIDFTSGELSHMQTSRGTGLGAISRLMDNLEIETELGKGTTIKAWIAVS